MIRGMLYRLSIRMEAKNKKDYIYVIEPKFIDESNIRVTFVSCYTNNRYDEHDTLNIEEYDK